MVPKPDYELTARLTNLSMDSGFGGSLLLFSIAGIGKHLLIKVYMHFLGHWARKLSWKKTAESFHTTLG